MGDRLNTIDMGRKEGGCCGPFGGMGPHLTQYDGPMQVYIRTKWHLVLPSRLATTDMGRRVGGGAVPLFRGAGSPSNTMSPALRPTSVPSGILIHPAVWPKHTWAENLGAVPLWEEELGFHLTQCGQAEAYIPTKWHLDPSSRLATIHGPKSGGTAVVLIFFLGGRNGYQVSSWSIQPSGHSP